LTTSDQPDGVPAAPTGLKTWGTDVGSWELRPVDATLHSADGVPFVGTVAVVTPERRAVTLTVHTGATGARITLTDGDRTHSFGLSPNGGTTP
jgi:hypothetical protein